MYFRYLLIILFISFHLFSCIRTDTPSKLDTYESSYNDTIDVGFTYWWNNSGPFIGACGEHYSLAFTGVIKQVDTPIIDSSLLYIPQKGVVKIHTILKANKNFNKEYTGKKHFTSDCFYKSNATKGDTVIVFCYEYEDSVCIPGPRSIIKIRGFDDPLVNSIKNYIQQDENPIVLKGDMELWKSKGFEHELRQIITCAEETLKDSK